MSRLIVLATAGADFGKNAATWGLDQFFWLALAAGLIGAAVLAVKKNVVGAGMTAVVTAIVSYFIKNPQKLADLGAMLAEKIGF